MAPGRKTGGRKKGTPNHVTTGARERILKLWDEVYPTLGDYYRRLGEGEPVPMIKKDGEVFRPVIDAAGNEVLVRQGADPGKAFFAAMQLLEYVLPKQARVEHTGEDGEAIRVIVKTEGE